MEQSFLFELVVFLIGQSVVIIGAIVTTFVRTQTSIARLEVEVTNVQDNTHGLRQDHKDLAVKVDGVSRHVAKLDGRCLAVHHSLKVGQPGAQ